MALSFLHFPFPLSLLSPFIKVYFYLSARGWECVAAALAAWHFVKIVSCGTSNLTKNNSLCSGAAFFPTCRDHCSPTLLGLFLGDWWE